MTMREEPDAIDPHLRAALSALAEADANLGAAAGVEARLRLAVRDSRRARGRRRQLVWLAASAGIVIAVTAARWGRMPEPKSVPAATQATAVTPVADAAPAEFLPLRYAHVPAGNGQIVRIVVPASALASFGLEPSSAGSDAVTADVFVGEDGLARAVRFSPVTTRELVQ